MATESSATATISAFINVADPSVTNPQSVPPPAINSILVDSAYVRSRMQLAAEDRGEFFFKNMTLSAGTTLVKGESTDSGGSSIPRKC